MQAPLSSHQLPPPKPRLNWDVDDWKWDADLFLATPTLALNLPQPFFPPAPAFSSHNAPPRDDAKAPCDRPSRVILLDAHDEDTLPPDLGSALTLKLGPHPPPSTSFPTPLSNFFDDNTTRAQQAPLSNRPTCQVQNCGADLSNAKDYHRRHKVCAMHAKAGNALVGNVVQRFCQQCSRFHLLQEFDEGKRSCRRRLAGHNKRRRKSQPDADTRENPLGNERTGNFLLITLSKVLSTMNSNSPDKANNHELISHLLKCLSGVSDANAGQQSGFLPAIQGNKIDGASFGEDREHLFGPISNGINHVFTNKEPSQPFGSSLGLKHGNDRVTPSIYPTRQSETLSSERSVRDGCGEIIKNNNAVNSLTTSSLEEGNAAKAGTNEGKKRHWTIDLNNVCNDETDNFVDGSVRSVNHANGQAVSSECPQWALQESHEFSPPQTSGNSDSASAQSLASSNGDAQSRTDRIVFKLFGKDPSHFPHGLRMQISDWLSNSPTDIESYIRPGCIILTLYLRLSETTWEELYGNLSSSLNKLLELYKDSFWQSGWIYTRIHQQIIFICDGHVVLNTRLEANDHDQGCIMSITPIAVAVCEQVNFLVKGINLCRPSTRLLCAFEGDYVLLESSVEDELCTSHEECEETQVIGFSCSIPSVLGRGFIEVEDGGLSCSFFPFIVADRDMVLEIRSLESVLDAEEQDHAIDGELRESKSKKDAINFLHEMGWLLKRSQIVSRLGQTHFGSQVFSLRRFKWLLEFSVDHDWCAVVKKLLNVLFEGVVDLEGHPSRKVLLEVGLLHRAVRRNCKAMVEFLLRYVPTIESDKNETDADLAKNVDGYLFRPDMPGPAGMTPLHIAASRDDAEMILDALTDDPGQVGVGAWKAANDNSGFAPQDYAHLRGYFSYIHLVQRKTKNLVREHCTIDLPSSVSGRDSSFGCDKVDGVEIEKGKSGAIGGPSCKACARQQLVYRSVRRRSLVYRPAMLSLVAIAAVCVCVALLLKGPPEVALVFPPFRWERLEYGAY